MGDQGRLIASGVVFDVADTQKQGRGLNAHIGKVSRGTIKLGDKLQAEVDVARRQAIVINHSATHLLHAALRQVLGDHVTQKGSLVKPDSLRFDFAHFEAVTADELQQVEQLVNQQIRANNAVVTRLMNYDQAVEVGAMALFGEKYGDEVRVLSIGDFSTELCGGTHAQRAGDIGLFKIVMEAGTAAGVRRIEALTGAGALNHIGETEKNLGQIAGLLRGTRDDAATKVGQLLEQNRRLEKELDQLKAKLASSQGSDLVSQAIEIGGIQLLAAKLEGADAKALRETVDQLKNKLGSAVVILASVVDGKVVLAAGVTQDQTARLKAGELVNHVALQVGGKGGGRPDMAQAGGTNPAALDAALASVETWMREKIS